MKNKQQTSNEDSIEQKSTKEQHKEEFIERIGDTIEKEMEHLFWDDLNTTEKVKEWTRIILINAYLIPPKILAVVFLGPTLWIPVWMALKILSTYLLLMPDNSETENKTIQNINSKTGLDFLLKNRPRYMKAIRSLSVDEWERQLKSMKESAIKLRKKAIRV